MSPNAQSGLDEIKNEMSPAELFRAEQYVSSWKPNVTELTKKASDGRVAANELIKKG